MSAQNNPPTMLEFIAREIVTLSGDGSLLVFANSRRVVELLADILNRLAHDTDDSFPLVLCHHGSLPKELRETAEQALKSGRPVIVLATSSLELGIDLGSIHRVIQIDSSWTLSSLRQRMGRSGRVEGQPSRLRLFTRDQLPIREVSLTASLFPNLLRAVAMVRLLLQGIVEPADRQMFHLSTLVHQILSSVRQWGAVDAGKLHQLLCVSGPFRKVDPQLFVDILRSLKGHDLVGQDSAGSIVLGRQGERITDDYHFYAAFVTRDEFTVRWNENAIGLLPVSELPPPGTQIILGGRRWRVEEIQYRTKIIEVTPAEAGSPPVFLGDKGDVHDLVLQEMQHVLADTDMPAYLDSKAREMLSSARATARSAGLLSAQVLHRGEKILWVPWRGTRCLLTLRLFALGEGIKCSTDDLALTYQGLSLEKFRLHLQRTSSGCNDPAWLASFMEQKHFQKFDEFLDTPLLNLANAHDRLDLRSAKDAAAAALQELESTRSNPIPSHQI